MNNISFTSRTGSPGETVYDVVNFQTDDKWVEVGVFFFFWKEDYFIIVVAVFHSRSRYIESFGVET